MGASGLATPRPRTGMGDGGTPPASPSSSSSTALPCSSPSSRVSGHRENREMEFKLVVGNVSSYLSADPGVVTYLEGPLHTQQPPHWAVRSAAAIALLFKVGAIVLGLVSVVLLSYLGIMMSWGLAFGLPWTLAYFYFIWICPAHQL